MEILLRRILEVFCSQDHKKFESYLRVRKGKQYITAIQAHECYRRLEKVRAENYRRNKPEILYKQVVCVVLKCDYMPLGYFMTSKNKDLNITYTARTYSSLFVLLCLKISAGTPSYVHAEKRLRGYPQKCLKNTIIKKL